MKKGTCYLFVLSLVVFLTSCGGVNQDDLKKEIFDPSSGVLSQIKIGQSWEDLKTNANTEYWTIRDDEDSYQLRKDYSGMEKVFMTFQLEDGKIASYNLDIMTEKMSVVELKLFTVNIQNHLDENFPEKQGKYNAYEYNGKKYTIYVSESLDSDDWLSIGITSM